MTYTPLYTTVAQIQAKSGLSNTEYDLTVDANIEASIQAAENEIEMITGRKFTDGTEVTEYLSFKDKDLIGNYATMLVLNKYPVQSVSEFKILDIDGNAVDTFDTLTAVQVAAGTFETDDYWLIVSNDAATNTQLPNGKIRLKTQTISEGTNNVKITYTYGYSSVPTCIKDLASCIAAIRCWVAFMGGQYDRITSYSVPEQSVTKGDIFSRGKQAIESLNMEANAILDRIGRRPRRFFFASGGDR